MKNYITRTLCFFAIILFSVVPAAAYSRESATDPLLLKYVGLYNAGKELSKCQQNIIDVCKKDATRRESICNDIISLIQANLEEEKFEDIFYLTSLYKKIAKPGDEMLEVVIYAEGDASINLDRIEDVECAIEELKSIDASPELIEELSESLELAHNFFYGLDGTWLSLDYVKANSNVPIFVISIQNSNNPDSINFSLIPGYRAHKMLTECYSDEFSLEYKPAYANRCLRISSDSIYVAWSSQEAFVGDAYLASTLRNSGRTFAAEMAGEFSKNNAGYDFGDRLLGAAGGALVEGIFNSIADNMMAAKVKAVICELYLTREDDYTLKGLLKQQVHSIKEGSAPNLETKTVEITLNKLCDDTDNSYLALLEYGGKNNLLTFRDTDGWENKSDRLVNTPFICRVIAKNFNLLHTRNRPHNPDDCVICNKRYKVYFGAEVENVTPDNTGKKTIKKLNGRGVRIKNVDEQYIGFVMDTADVSRFKKCIRLRRGDIIIDINGIPCNSPDDYLNAVRSHQPGDIAYIRIMRKKKERVVKTRFIYAEIKE